MRRTRRRSMMRRRRRRVFPEPKFSLVTSATTSDPVSSDSPFIMNLTGDISQSLLVTGRVGNKVNPKFITIRADYNAENTATIAWYVVIWLMDESADPFTTTDFLGSPGDVTSFRNFQNRQKYRIIRRGTFTMFPRSTNDAPRFQKMVIRPRMPMLWDDATAASATTKHIFFLAYSEIPDASGPPTVNFASKFFYADP